MLLWSVVFSCSMQQQWTISLLDYHVQQKVDFIQQPVMTSSVAGSWSSKALNKVKLTPRKGSWSLVVCSWSAPLQLFESWWNHYIWEVCSANQWDAPKTAVPVGSTDDSYSSPRQCLIACCITNASKVDWIGLWNFASSPIFTWPLANQLTLLQAFWQLFLQGICFYSHRRHKMLSKSSLNPKIWGFRF